MKKNIIEKIENFITELGYYVWEIKYSDGKNKRLDIFVDNVSLNECAELSRKISVFIESEDLILNSYLLTVSSPGVNRRLTKLEHYRKSIGKQVKIKANGEIYKGIIREVEDNNIIITVGEKPLLISFEDIEKANLNIL